MAELIKVGQDWQKIGECIINYVINKQQEFSIRPIVYSIPGLPFSIEFQRHPQAISPGLFFHIIPKWNIHEEIADRIKDKIKADQVGAYRKQGYQCVLVVETADETLMNIEALRKAVLDVLSMKPTLLEDKFHDLLVAESASYPYIYFSSLSDT